MPTLPRLEKLATWVVAVGQAGEGEVRLEREGDAGEPGRATGPAGGLWSPP
jgi:hypothetical protein